MSSYRIFVIDMSRKWNIISVMSAVGVDLGGTWIRAGLVSETGALLARERRRVSSDLSPTAIVDQVVETVAAVDEGNGPIGIGVPTTLDEDGRLRPCPNLPTLTGCAFASEVAVRSGRPVAVDNDTRCFAIGEHTFGSAIGRSSVAVVTLGTSVGLSLIIGGVPLRGDGGESGEIWRSPTHLHSVDTGQEPILHDALSAAALTSAYGVESGRTVDAATVFDFVRSGNRAAADAVEHYAGALSFALSWVCDLVDPELVIVGGSIARSFDVLRPLVEQRMGERSARVTTSVLGDDAALLGASQLLVTKEGVK